MTRSSAIPFPSTDENERGFTLLEVLVALSILSLSVAVLFGIFSQALERAHLDKYAMHARVLAQSLLAQVIASPVKHNGSGVDPEGYSWLVRITPPNESSRSLSGPILAVSLRVGWLAAGQQRFLSLNTLTFGSTESGP
jgi:general secretion pathway protein I